MRLWPGGEPGGLPAGDAVRAGRRRHAPVRAGCSHRRSWRQSLGASSRATSSASNPPPSPCLGGCPARARQRSAQGSGVDPSGVSRSDRTGVGDPCFALGLVIMVHGRGRHEALTWAAQCLSLAGGDLCVAAMAIHWASAVWVMGNNIPFVATTTHLIKSIAPTFGRFENVMPSWRSLALGACLGCRGTLVGVSANLIMLVSPSARGSRSRSFPLCA
jgi:hypothetical protein